MVDALRQRDKERLQNSLSREELFGILITWSVPISHLTEVERRKRITIIDNFHRQSAQQLIHAMFVGKKVRFARKATATSIKRKFFGAAKFVGKSSAASNASLATNPSQQDEYFDEVQCIRRASSKIADQRTLAEEQDAFVRACIKSKSQMVSSKKLLQKVHPPTPSLQFLVNQHTNIPIKITFSSQIQHDCMSAQIRLTEQACPPEDSQITSPIPSARESSPVKERGKVILYSNPVIPGSPLQ